MGRVSFFSRASGRARHRRCPRARPWPRIPFPRPPTAHAHCVASHPLQPARGSGGAVAGAGGGGRGRFSPRRRAHGRTLARSFAPRSPTRPEFFVSSDSSSPAPLHAPAPRKQLDGAQVGDIRLRDLPGAKGKCAGWRGWVRVRGGAGRVRGKWSARGGRRKKLARSTEGAEGRGERWARAPPPWPAPSHTRPRLTSPSAPRDRGTSTPNALHSSMACLGERRERRGEGKRGPARSRAREPTVFFFFSGAAPCPSHTHPPSPEVLQRKRGAARVAACLWGEDGWVGGWAGGEGRVGGRH